MLKRLILSTQHPPSVLRAGLVVVERDKPVAGRGQELEARHSLSNLSVHDLVEERRNYSLRPSCLIRLQH
ncbi:hypothetical protein HBI73_038730 [Parastagonospora nodorum]|nr:hypothetical protein HBI73_038730 [Parastagonospora nodorum]